MRFWLYFLLTAFLFPCIDANAVQVPNPTPSDARVRNVAYDPSNVVVINGFFGFQTYILFSEGEEITDIAAGDTEGWNIGVTVKKNGFFIKPRQDSPQTNITVLTNLRHYNFDMRMGGKSKFYMVRFTYPQEEAKKNQEAIEKAMMNALLDKRESGRALNYDYWYDGSERLKPVACWDNGTFTFFKFAPGRDFPAIYIVNPDDESEAVVNKHTDGNIVVVHKTAKQFVLRIGNSVTGIWNKSYQPVGPDLQGTSSPEVKRDVRGGI